MDMQFKTFPFEVKSAKPDGSEFEGLVSVFYNIDAYNEIVDDKAFDQDLPDFLENGFIGGLNHNWDSPIGKPQPGTQVTAKGLMLKGNVIDTTHGMDVRKMLAAGIVRKLSIGFKRADAKYLETAEEVDAYWQEKGYKPSAQDRKRAQSGAWVLTRIKLFEGSPVTVPANDLATITAVKAAREAALEAFKQGAQEEDETDLPASVREYEQYLRDAGLSKREAREAITKAKGLRWDAGADAGTSDETPEGAPEGEATEGKQDDTATDPPGETPGEEVSEETPAPTPTPSEEQARPAYTLPDDVTPETAAMRIDLARKLHSQFLQVSGRIASTTRL